jgi:hypothetical protein
VERYQMIPADETNPAYGEPVGYYTVKLGGQPVGSGVLPRNIFFDLNEFSASLKLHSGYTSHFISLFAGNFESPGMDSYYQTYFGMNPISSLAVKARSRDTGIAIYPSAGYGLAYRMRFRTPDVVGLYAYIVPDGKDTQENDFAKLNGLGFDLRYSHVGQKFLFDFSAGINMLNKYEGDSFGMSYMKIRAGITFYGGSVYGTSYLFQTGSAGFFDPEGAIWYDNVYLFLEPRFIFNNGLHFDFALFSLPEHVYKKDRVIGYAPTLVPDPILGLPLPVANTTKDKAIYLHDINTALLNQTLLFIHHPLGASMSLYADKAVGNSSMGRLGGNITLSVYGGLGGLMGSPAKHLDPLEDEIPPMMPSANISLFYFFTVYKGVFSALLSIDPLMQTILIDASTTPFTYTPESDLIGSVRVRLGYALNF